MNFFKEFLLVFVSVLITLNGVEVLKNNLAFFNTDNGWIELLAFMLVFMPIHIAFTLIAKKLGFLKVANQ